MTRLVLGLGCLFAFAACGGANTDPSTDPQGCGFVAFTGDFEGFRSWESFPLPESSEQAPVHLPGPKTDYLNKRPPPGSTEFPVGTIIVKELEVGPYESRQVFALVKRGCGYDAAGAPGWEWFELANKPDGTLLKYVWRGLGPPVGEMYGGDPNGCVGCHALAKSNDYVQSPPLLLSNL